MKCKEFIPLQNLNFDLLVKPCRIGPAFVKTDPWHMRQGDTLKKAADYVNFIKALNKEVTVCNGRRCNFCTGALHRLVMALAA